MRIFNIITYSFVLFIMAGVTPSHAHETWLLTPEQIISLNSLPIPEAFLPSNIMTMLIILTMTILFLVGYLEEFKYKLIENKIEKNILPHLEHYFPLMVRICMGLLLLYASFGGLPRHGISIGSPTLFVPDLNLQLLGATGTEWLFLGKIEFILAMMFFFGIFVRLASLLTMLLVLTGTALFGVEMTIAYVAHLLMPCLYLLCIGGGRYYTFSLNLNPHFQRISDFFASCDKQTIYQFMLIGTGFNFILLGTLFKFLQPNLIIFILEEGGFMNLGIPIDYLSLIMACIEVFAGICIVMGILVRPLSLFIVGAMCMFAVVLGESLVMHANIFALMFLFIAQGGLKTERNKSRNHFSKTIPSSKRNMTYAYV